MSQSKSKSPAVKNMGDHEVITPPHGLKKAMATRKPGAPPAPDPVKQAEEALAAISHEFKGWMRAEGARLDAARREFKKATNVAEYREALFRTSHDIRGQAATFGYPLIQPVADSLCRLLEFTPEPGRIPAPLVDQHVDAIRAMIAEDAGENDLVAQNLAKRLREVTNDFLAAENHDRPQVLELIFGPPLAPA